MSDYDPQIEAEINESIPMVDSPLLMTLNADEFESHLSSNAKIAFNNVQNDTALAYLLSSNGTIFISPKTTTAAEYLIIKKYNDLIKKIDPEVKLCNSHCLFGGITVKSKVKDFNKIDDSVIIKELAETYNYLIEKEYILPAIFCAPYKLPLAIIHPTIGGTVYENSGSFKLNPLSSEYFIAKHKLSIESDEAKINDLTAIINEYEREYSKEEIDEFDCRVIYTLWVYPSLKFNEEYLDELGLMSIGDFYNKILGKPFFVNEGEAPRLEINF